MKTKDYLEEAKRKTGLASDYALGKRLGITKQAMSGYATGNRIMDDYTAAKVAELLDINALEVIAAANAEREKDSAKVEFWRRLGSSSRAATLAGVLILGGFFVGSGALDFYQTIHYANLLLYVILAGAGIGLTYKFWRQHGKTGPF